MGLWVLGLGFGVWGLGFEVWNFGSAIFAFGMMQKLSNLVDADLEKKISQLASIDRVGWDLERIIVPPFSSEADSEMLDLCEKLTGYESGSVAFATEAPFLQQLGMDVVVLGPGDIEVAHQPDEYLALDRIDPTISFLSKLIGHSCL